ncbi:alpha-2-macroglobulin-like protein 1 isoform X2 [Oxyura jamaicensis]|uniref:alpha-2-macroglobulin-like protein 1 isoform X2 n=1 Tax=Oxyura jamaicensis TaxID=8884 RepID=UPI0015A68431|nr:alpha-2-macroglobulin-like protein 1 isoform X2 [Oxyura jamaicensis]
MRIAILLSLLFHAAAAFHQLHYLVVIPADLRYPSTQVACLHITCYEAKLQVNLVLERSAGHNLLVQETIQKEKTFMCAKFWVAPPADGTEEIATVKLLITGQGVSIEEKKKVLIRKASSGTFIQTDRPIYKPGETVKFRIVTLDEDFIALNDSISLFLQDPNSNRIEQWLNVVPQDGIADLSFQLSDEPLLGTYVINVTNGEAYDSFSVEDYALPRFEVIFEVPIKIYALDKTFPLRVCGRYTYGKGVQGMVHVQLCQKIAVFLPSASKPDLCQEFHSQTDKMGCFFTNVTLSSFSRDFRYYQDSIVAEASVVEDGTEIQVNASHKLLISKIGGMALFDDVNSYYHTGEMYRGKIRVTDYKGKTLKYKKVLLIVSSGEQQFQHKYTTGDAGEVSFSLNTTSWNSTSASLEASVLHQDLDREPGTVDLNYQKASHFIHPFYSTSRSFLTIVRVPEMMPCSKKQAIQVDFRIYQEDLEHGPKRVIFSYFFTGKRGIVHTGQKTVWVGLPRMLKGFFSIPVTFSSVYAPAPTLIVYVIFPNGKIIADSATFSVSPCFRNKVELGFSTSQTLPDSEVGLNLLAAPGSTCAVWAVDQSVFLLKPEKELSSSMIYGLFPSVYNSGYPHQVSEDDHSCGFPNSDEPDVFTAFKEMGLKIMSNTNIRKPRLCLTTQSTTMLQETGVITSRPMLMFAQPHKAHNRHLLTSTHQPTMFSPVSPAEEKVHKYFTKTWIWDLYSVGSSGNKSVTVTVPGTITEWKAGMFCTGHNGFGLAPTSSLLVFKPFFVDLTLPSSVIQGETFILKATVFNYLQRCMKVQVTVEEFTHFQLKPCKGCVYSSCLCAGEDKTFQWSVTAEQLGLMNITISTEAVATKELCGKEIPFVPNQGQKDTITKLLLVRPEGVLVEKAHSSILCPKKGSPAQESVSLMLPQNVVEGSVRATVSVTGDLMGTVLQNLDNLVHMPHGCGEQNMVLFAPIVYVLQYLEKTGQLTPEIKERATGFLRKGYQIQLQYQHPDGSFSEFGTKDEYGNTWLTSFVVKCFVQAKPYIFLDNRSIQAALNWLEFHQLPNGCFRNVGQLFHTAMKGGVDGEVPLAAYITAAYLEAGETPESTVVRKALGCIAHSLPKAASTYTQALLAYTFALAKDPQRTQELLDMLDQKAIRAGGQIHWSQSPSETPSAWSQPLSVDVELTAYVLLALLSKPNVTRADLTTASGIVAWLTRQQNAYGGFASTQDTVVALQALAKYAALTYSTKGVAEVRVRSQKGFGRKFQVSYQNRLSVQEVALTEIPGKFSVQAHGSCCVFTRMVLRYNTPFPQVSKSFFLRVKTKPVNCTRDDTHSVTLYVNVRYTGKRAISNMVIVEVSLLSGFVLAPGSGMPMEHWHPVKRTEKTQAGVAIYLDKLSHKSETYVLHLEREIGVTNLKPGHVRVYDYYHPEEQAMADYNVFCI